MIVKMIGRHIIIYQDYHLKCLSDFLYFDRYHEFLHRALMPSKSPRSFLLDILKNPSKILLFEGSMKTNLQLLTLFVNKKTSFKICSSMKTDQKTLCNIINYVPREWRELLEFDPDTFKKLNLYLESQIEDKIYFDGTMLDLLKMANEKSTVTDERNKNIEISESSSMTESNNYIKNEITQLIKANDTNDSKNDMKDTSNNMKYTNNYSNDIKYTNNYSNDMKYTSNYSNDMKDTNNDSNDMKYTSNYSNDMKDTNNDSNDMKDTSNYNNDMKDTSNDIKYTSNDIEYKPNYSNDMKDIDKPNYNNDMKNVINKINRINRNKYIIRTVECLHEIFCENNEKESAIDRLMTNYKKLIKDIKNKKSLKIIYEEFPFHHEFKLINDYTIVKEYGGDFNMNLINYNWVTKNEKIIVNYILTEINKYNNVKNE